MIKKEEIKVVAFDADDTLWDCQTWFDEVEQQCCELLKPWATAREVSEGLFATERKNLSLTGYGTKAFTLSLIENALRVSHEQLTGDIVMRLIELGQQLLRFPTTPLPEVEETLRQLADRSRNCNALVWSSTSLTWKQCRTRLSASIVSSARI